MKADIEAKLDDLYQLPDDQKAELVDGELVLMSPTGGIPGYAAGEIFASLRSYARSTQLGYAVADNVGFVVDLPQRKSFSPDAAFYVGTLTMKFLEGAPRFAVEVRSEHDYGNEAERSMAAKRTDYFAAGTEVVWDVDLLSESVVRVFRAANPNEPTIYRRGEQAEAEPALPGWQFAVNDLFLIA